MSPQGWAQGGWHADGVQHDRRLRQPHHGHAGHARLAGEPRDHRRLDRADGPGARVRRAGVHRGVRQDRDRRGIMALARLDVPAVVLYSGSDARPLARPGTSPSRTCGRPSASARSAGSTRPTWTTWPSTRGGPGPGTCAAQYTANTMASVVDFLGLAPVRHRRHPGRRPRGTKNAAAERVGEIVMDALVPATPGPRAILTEDALHNAIARGGRHGRLDERRTAPARHRPRGRTGRCGVDEIGGHLPPIHHHQAHAQRPAHRRRPVACGERHLAGGPGGCWTSGSAAGLRDAALVDGRTYAESVAAAAEEAPGQQVVTGPSRTPTKALRGAGRPARLARP